MKERHDERTREKERAGNLKAFEISEGVEINAQPQFFCADKKDLLSQLPGN